MVDRIATFDQTLSRLLGQGTSGRRARAEDALPAVAASEEVTATGDASSSTYSGTFTVDEEIVADRHGLNLAHERRRLELIETESQK